MAFRGGVSASAYRRVERHARNLSRGFRAPHITDLGTLGLTGSGFEVAAPDVAGLGGTVGSTADATAVSLGTPIEQVGPETSLTYEGGLHYRRSTRAIDAGGVRQRDPRQHREAVADPAAGRGRHDARRHADHRQSANGVVFVAAATNPVLVRVNFDNARIFGVEHTFDWRPTPQLAGRHHLHLPAREGHAHRAAAEHRGRHAGAGGVHSR